MQIMQPFMESAAMLMIIAVTRRQCIIAPEFLQQFLILTLSFAQVETVASAQPFIQDIIIKHPWQGEILFARADVQIIACTPDVDLIQIQIQERAKLIQQRLIRVLSLWRSNRRFIRWRGNWRFIRWRSNRGFIRWRSNWCFIRWRGNRRFIRWRGNRRFIRWRGNRRFVRWWSNRRFIRWWGNWRFICWRSNWRFIRWRGNWRFIRWRGNRRFIRWRSNRRFVRWRGNRTFIRRRLRIGRLRQQMMNILHAMRLTILPVDDAGIIRSKSKEIHDGDIALPIFQTEDQIVIHLNKMIVIKRSAAQHNMVIAIAKISNDFVIQPTLAHIEDIIPCAAGEYIIARTANKFIVAFIAMQFVITRPTK